MPHLQAAQRKIISVVPSATQIVRPGYDKQIEKSLRRFFDDHMTIEFDHFPLTEDGIAEAGGRVEEHPCRPRGGRA